MYSYYSYNRSNYEIGIAKVNDVLLISSLLLSMPDGELFKQLHLHPKKSLGCPVRVSKYRTMTSRLCHEISEAVLMPTLFDAESTELTYL